MPRSCSRAVVRSATTSGCWPTSSTSCRAICATCCCAIPNLPHPDAPDGVGDADNPVVKGPVNLPGRVRRAPAGAALGDRRRARHPRQRAGHQDQRGDVHDAARAAAPRWRGRCASYALDRNADAFEEIRPPTLVTTATLTATGQLPKFADDAYAIERDDLWCIPTAEVPLTSIYAGEVARRGRPAAAVHGVHAVLPARGRLGRPRHPRHAARPRVRQGRDPRRRHARAGARPARRDDRPGRGD